MAMIYLVRHGQASFGAADYDALSETGFAQARVLGETLKPRLSRVDQVWRGSMRRHAETAETCMAAFGWSGQAQVDPRFNEFNHEEVLDRHRPDWIDRSLMRAELAKSDQPMRCFQAVFEAAMTRWFSGVHDADYSESSAHFQARALAALVQLEQQLGRDGVALVFTSGGVISAIVQQQLQLPPAQALALSFLIVNCSLSKLLVGSSGRHLLSLNEHGHFEGEREALLSYR